MMDHNAIHHHKLLHFPQLPLLFSISSFLYSFLSILLFLFSTRVRITCYPRIIYMATIRAKDSLRKEKKVATPSSSPKPATATNSDHKLKSSTPPSSSSSAKPVPNYLKPTLSSKSESLKFVKKPNHSNNNEDPAQKQLLRRRSFDRPPSSVRAQTSLISSPDPKERVAASRIPNNRPSSASTVHTTAYYRPVLDRNSKSLKPTVRSLPQQVHRPVANSAGTLLKRSKSLTKNNNSHSSKSPSSSIPPPPDETQDLNLEINQETTNNESLVQESAELEAVNNVEDMDVAEDSQVKDGGDVHHHEDENIKIAETSIVEEVSSVVSDQVEVNEIELRHEVVHQDENIQEELEHEDQKEERDENQLDDTKLVDNRVIIDDRKEEENIVNEKTPEEESEAVVEETKNEELVSEQVKLKNEELDVQEIVAVENRVEEGNQEINNSSNNNSNATQNKKQPAAYNDVIEETKNKLLEKRKNKVKALVGAFETVIDYETAAGSNK